VVLFAAPEALSQSRLPNGSIHTLVVAGIDLTWKEQYSSADSVFQVVIREFPEHPAGYLYRAGVMLSRAIDNEMEVDLPKFDSLVALGKTKADMLTASATERPWGIFYLGTADGSDSYARVYRGDWFGGTRKGFSSVSSFKDALKLDSNLSDACAGIGAFYYWRSRKTETFNWLPFVGDDRNEGVALLNRAVDRGIYNKYTALNMLVAIYTDAALYDEAAACSRKGLERYPGNRSFLWGLATALQLSSKWKEAAEAYLTLFDVILRSQDNNHYNEIVCMLNLAKVKIELNEAAYARRLLTGILRYHESDFPAHLRDRAKDKLDKAQAMLAKLDRAEPPAGK